MLNRDYDGGWRGCIGLICITLFLLGSMEKHQQEFLDTVIELCVKSRNDWYRVYLIRKICSLQGVEAAREMQKEATFHWLFPQEIIQQVTKCLICIRHAECSLTYMWKLLNLF